MKKIKTGPKQFKTRNMSKQKNTGSTCSGLGKNVVLDELNDILELIGLKKMVGKVKKSKHELCVIQEMILRLADKGGKTKKRWFLTPEEIEQFEEKEKKIKK